MSEQQNRPAYHEDEFDVEVMAGKLWRIQKKIWKKIFFPFTVLFLRPKRLVLIMGISILLAVILRYTLPPFYESSFVIKPSNSGDVYYLGMLHDLNLMLKDKNWPAVAEKLKVDVATAEKLHQVDVSPIYKNTFRQDTITAVEIALIMSDAMLIDTFQQSILTNYLCGSPYYFKSKQIRKKDLAAMEVRMVADLEENDSLKKVLTRNAFPRGNGGFVYGEPLDPLKVYEAGFAMYQKMINLRSELEYTESFELVKPGVVRIKPFFPRLIILLPVFIGIGLIVCLVLNYREYKG
ncbi:MAG: hypothetical protein V4658_01180 [Bacteroidota bacterium]